MKNYKIYAFNHYGTFYCNVIKEGKETLLRGKFNKKGHEYTFILNSQDTEL